ncbi:PQQ-binding-like beta-propeller repeat protein [Paraoerskovia sediminicola]|uniref:PQQ-binding-like beta-propeller repeat protein n=1 Tax=Paraoerskovia sediminicola TaxID=1138587 RepID=UPI0025747193|nr:PQQ-binding-like beta-propeller repeat protein [Paraoerskovia sediminicola]
MVLGLVVAGGVADARRTEQRRTAVLSVPGGVRDLSDAPAETWRSRSGGAFVLAGDGLVTLGEPWVRRDPATGDVAWTSDVGAPVGECAPAASSGAAVADGPIVCAVRRVPGTASGFAPAMAGTVVVDPASGEVVARRRVPPWTRDVAPVTGGRVAYLLAEDGEVRVSMQDAVTGEELWSRSLADDLLRTEDGREGYVGIAFHDGVVVIETPTSTGALDLDGGTPSRESRFGDDQDAYSGGARLEPEGPATAPETVVVASDGGRSVLQGRVVQGPLVTDGTTTPSALLADDEVWRMVDLASGEALWERAAGVSYVLRTQELVVVAERVEADATTDTITDTSTGTTGGATGTAVADGANDQDDQDDRNDGRGGAGAVAVAGLALLGLDRSTGEERWRVDPDAESIGVVRAAVTDGERLAVVGTGTEGSVRMEAYSLVDGTGAWAWSDPDVVGVWPVSGSLVGVRRDGTVVGLG